MKKIVIMAAALLLVGCPLSFAQYRVPDYSSLNDSETVSVLKEHIRYIASPSMKGRAPGSEGEKETAIYVTDVLSRYGLDMLSGAEGDEFGLKRENGDTLVSRNVLAFIQGSDKKLKDKFIVVGARMDNLGTMTLNVDGEKETYVYCGANGNASGLAMLLELSRMLKTNAPMLRRSVLICAFGASQEMFAGSWYLLNRSFSATSDIEAMVGLDVLGTASEGFLAYAFSNPDMEQMARALEGTLQPVYPKITSDQPFVSDQISFYDKEIPSIMFTNGRYPEYRTHKDTESIIEYAAMEGELEYIFNYVVSLCNGPAPIFNVESEIRKRSSEGTRAIPYYDCDRKPVFLGSSDPRIFLEKWVYQYLRYPEDCIREGIQGKVLVDFVIDEAGKVTDAKVLKGVDPLLDAEALRVVTASPPWKPGYVKGKKVRSEISLYIEFRLEKKKKR